MPILCGGNDDADADDGGGMCSMAWNVGTSVRDIDCVCVCVCANVFTVYCTVVVMMMRSTY